jgi:hypothetical protein
MVSALAFSCTIAIATMCPFCGSQGQTLGGEVNTADFIIVVKPANAKPDKDDFTRGTTDLLIKSVVKDHPYLHGKSQFTVSRLIPVAAGSDDRLLVFAFVEPKPAPFQAGLGSLIAGNVSDAPVDAYRGVEISAESKLADYLKGAIAVREKDAVTRLRYFFNYLDAPELEINSDAFMEFGNADYNDVRKLATTLPKEKVFGWLKDPNTLSSRFGLYGLFAGHCGTKADAEQIRTFLDDPKRRFASGLDGLLAGYVLLDPKAGWEYMTALITNPDKQDFATQVAIVKVMRYFWDYRQDVVGPDQLVATMMKSASNGDFADFAIEDLRKWGRFEKTDDLLKLCAQESHKKEPMVKRALIKFMLAAAKATKHKAAVEFVEEARKDNPDRIKDYEEILEQEAKELRKKAG